MEISAKDFQTKVLNNDKPVLLECWASWCLPCKQIEPMLQSLAETYRNRCDIFKINLDKNPAISQQYSIRGLPTMLMFFHGKIVERRVGSLTSNQIAGMIDSTIALANADSQSDKTDSTMLTADEQKIVEERLKALMYL